jgi:hypothetical protein
MQKKRQSGLSDANVSVIRAEPEMKRVILDSDDCEEPSFVETGEAKSDIDAECLTFRNRAS